MDKLDQDDRLLDFIRQFSRFSQNTPSGPKAGARKPKLIKCGIGWLPRPVQFIAKRKALLSPIRLPLRNGLNSPSQAKVDPCSYSPRPAGRQFPVRRHSHRRLEVRPRNERQRASVVLGCDARGAKSVSSSHSIDKDCSPDVGHDLPTPAGARFQQW
jgi:hypothetical protein